MAPIREMRLSDLDVVDILEKELFLSSAWSKEAYESELLTNPFDHYVVLEEAGVIVGYCGYYVLYENSEILTIGVSKKHQGKGYARMMMDYMISQSIIMGAEVMSLEVRASNSRAQKLYKGYGFKDVAIRPHYYNDGENAILMVKGLEVKK